jgi:hypothetical protein
MTHADPFDLAASVTGDALDAETRAHVDSCEECTGVLRELQAVAAHPEPADLPSPAVWRGIHDELGLQPAVETDPLTAAPVLDTAAKPRSEPARRRRLVWISGLAAAAVVIAVLGVLVGVRIATPPTPPAPAVIAQTALEPFPGWDDAGHATIEQTEAGDRYLTVTLSGSAPEGDVREVWLMRSDLKALISLGLLDQGTGRFAIPSDIDLSQYDVVDVSAEAVDGNPAHSGDSIVRGTLKIA